MRSPWRRAVGVIFSVLVPLAGCSESDVDFPPTDSGSEAAADVSADPRVDAATDGGRSDPDVSSDVCTSCEDVVTRDDRVDTSAPETSSDADAAPDLVPPDVPDDDVTADVPADMQGDPRADADDGSDDATSEEAGTCASRCASGVCDMNGDCTPCVRDEECTGGRVCNAGTCGPRCGDGGVLCTGNLVCCTDHCVDTTRDPRHCGACGMNCGAQFCGNASTPVCRDSLVRNICNAKKATFLLDGLPADNAASNVLRAAIAAHCVPVPTLTSVDQTMSVAINTATGQPLAGGGELLVAAGGDTWQRLVKYLETSRTSPVYNEFDGLTTLYFKRRGGAPDGGDAVLRAVSVPTVTATHDFFLVYVVKDPISGTFSLVVYGVDTGGTSAGAFYFANVMLPNIVGADVTSVTQAWYLYEWTAADGGTGPSMSDTFTLIDSGI
jgi:hypothetical protein